MRQLRQRRADALGREAALMALVVVYVGCERCEQDLDQRVRVMDLGMEQERSQVDSPEAVRTGGEAGMATSVPSTIEAMSK